MAVSKRASLALMAVCLACASGCFSEIGPNFGPFNSLISVPIPVSPYFQKKFEDDHHWHERYGRVPIMGPVTQGPLPEALDPPSDDEVMRALEKARPVQGGIPLLHGVQRDNVRILIEPLADYVDPPRFYPTIGPAQHHHQHYKCTVYFEETTHVGWPIPFTKKDEDASEVIYIDHNHLHVVEGVDGGPGSNY